MFSFASWLLNELFHLVDVEELIEPFCLRCKPLAFHVLVQISSQDYVGPFCYLAVIAIVTRSSITSSRAINKC